MRAPQHFSRRVALAVALCVVVAAIVAPLHPIVLAETFFVVDVDGSIEDYAAITTILQHPDYRRRLRLVSVSGTTWGYGPTVVRNLCRFVSLAGGSSTTVVALGEVASSADEYNTRSHQGKCAEVQGFPATPHDAELRGMPYSRADVTSAYGQTYTLPYSKTSESSCGYHVAAATDVFLALLRQVDASRDTIVYLQLGSAANLAAFAGAVQEKGNPALVSKFHAVMEAHLFETGYSGGADNTSMSTILSASEDDNRRVKARLYLPIFYNPGVTFNFQTWASLGTIANTTGTSKAVTWLYNAWARKKALLDAKNMGDSVAFFKERGPASSLVALCAVDDSIRSLCQSYRKAALKLNMVTVKRPAPASAAESVVAVSGNNVTVPFYYVITAPSDEQTAMATSYAYSTPASQRVGTNTKTLVDEFWNRWFYLLQL